MEFWQWHTCLLLHFSKRVAAVMDGSNRASFIIRTLSTKGAPFITIRATFTAQPPFLLMSIPNGSAIGFLKLPRYAPPTPKFTLCTFLSTTLYFSVLFLSQHFTQRAQLNLFDLTGK